MLWDNLGRLRKDWDSESIKKMFFMERDRCRKELIECICELANSDDYKSHVKDYCSDICDLIHMAEEDGDARIHAYSAYEKYLESTFGEEDLMAQNIDCIFSNLKQLNQFIKEMAWEEK